MAVLNMFLTVFSPYTTVLALLIISFRVLKNQDLLYKNPWNTGLLLLFVWSLFVGIINGEPLSSTASLGLLIYFLFSVYLQNNYSEESKIEILFKKLVMFSIGSSLIGFAEKITATYCSTIWWGSIFGIPTQIASKEAYRIYSTFGNPNVAGTWFAFVILICLYFYDHSEKLQRFYYGAACAIFTFSLFLTGSRGAAIGLIMGLVVYGLLKKEKKRMGLLTAVFLFVAVSMCIYPTLFPMEPSYSTALTHEVSDSASSRQLLWQSGLNMFSVKPLTGWGLLGVYFADPKLYLYHTREVHAHNIWITIAATLGIVGLAIYGYMRYSLYKTFKVLWDSKCRLVPLLLAIQALVIGHGIVDFTIMTPQGGFIFFGCSALVYGLAMQYSGSNTRDYYSVHALFGRHKTRRPYESPQKV